MERYSSAQLFDILKTDGSLGQSLFDVDSLSEYLELGSVSTLEADPAFLPAAAHTAGHNTSSSQIPEISEMFSSWQQRPNEASHNTSSAEHSGAFGPPHLAQPKEHKMNAAAVYNSTAEEEGEGAPDGESWGAGGAKKKRTRNNQQMELNRVAQQRYRERKKAEYNELQSAVDQLTAQLAAIRALEARNEDLEIRNASLVDTHVMHSGAISSLQEELSEKSTALAVSQAELTATRALVGSQQRMILDQHARLQLQEQIIVSLKERLKESIDGALEHIGIGSVCDKLIAAVKASLYGAKDVDGLQDALEALPDHLVVEICKNILYTCKSMWPDLDHKLKLAGAGQCVPQCHVSAGKVIA
ncbi:MAG: hypothetical protein WDW38_001856 [Sanguina aurantia]